MFCKVYLKSNWSSWGGKKIKKKEARYTWHEICGDYYWCSPNLSVFLLLLGTWRTGLPGPGGWVAPFCRVLANELGIEVTAFKCQQDILGFLLSHWLPSRLRRQLLCQPWFQND